MTRPPIRLKGPQSKYRAKPQVVDGIRFASKKEAARYGTLKLLQQAKVISSLELQPKFLLTVNGFNICTYIADFSYFDERGERVIEDAKGMKTPVYRLKKKLLLACRGIEVREV